MNPYVTFFHNSDYHWKKTPTLFQPLLREENKVKPIRPVFYWFNDMFHDHLPHLDKYFYLFVKNPKKDKIYLRARHEGYDFNGLCKHQYDYYYKERAGKDLGSYYKNPGVKGNYYQPSVIMSFSNKDPDLVIKFAEDEKKCKYEKYGTVLYPESHKGTVIYLFDENYYPIKFTDIPEIVNIVPKINFSYPFLTPKKVNGKYVYEDWVPMITEKMGTWI